MKTETCVFSGYKIYPGHGKRLVKADGKVHIFLNSKCERSFKMKKNPRETTWTVLYRRKHKKGAQAEEITKKKTRKTQKFQRAVGNTSLADIMAKRNQKPEVRKAMREQAIKAAKEQARATKSVKKTEKAKAKPSGQKMKAPKPMKGILSETTSYFDKLVFIDQTSDRPNSASKGIPRQRYISEGVRPTPEKGPIYSFLEEGYQDFDKICRNTI